MPNRAVASSASFEAWLTQYNLLNGDVLAIDTRIGAVETSLSGYSALVSSVSGLDTRVGSLAGLAAGIISAEADDSIIEAINYVHSLAIGTTAEYTSLVVSGTTNLTGLLTAVNITSTGTIAAAALTVAGSPVWTAANDGATSGLDSDLLDGQHGAYYRAWGNLTGVPSTFTPSAHVHAAADITSGVLAVARGGTGIGSYTTGNYIRAQGASTLEQRTPAQLLSDIGAAAAVHTHIIADITGLQTAIDGKAATVHTHATADIVSGTFADARIAASNVTQHNGVIAPTWTNVSGKPSTFTPATHTHAASDVTSGVFDSARIPSLPYLLSSGGTLTGDFAITSVAPLITLTENDQAPGSQISRLFRSSNILYIESEGEIRFTGLNAGNLSALTVRTGGVTRTIWHSGNMGAGSGLDADTLDTLSSAAFARIDISNSANFVTTGEVRGSLFRFDGNDEYLGRSGDSIIGVVNNTTRIQVTTTGLSVTGALVASGDVSGFSDQGLKKEIRPIDSALERVKALQGVTFDWNARAHKMTPGLRKSRKAGVLYQQVQKVFPEATAKHGDVGTVEPLALIGLLVAAINELEARA